MRNLLTVFIVFLFFSLDFAVLSYGQSDCADWGSPLEYDISNDDVNSPFNPQSHYGTDHRAADGWNVLAVADVDGAIFDPAELIDFAAQIYGINPQVILATLQKEQTAITAGKTLKYVKCYDKMAVKFINPKIERRC
ncbi:MAG: hypothetical protein HZA07_02350 [Nitrospirae bacterium]|nr:hypothetical protein [Nitrospirota bacterium]